MYTCELDRYLQWFAVPTEVRNVMCQTLFSVTSTNHCTHQTLQHGYSGDPKGLCSFGTLNDSQATGTHDVGPQHIHATQDTAKQRIRHTAVRLLYSRCPWDSLGQDQAS